MAMKVCTKCGAEKDVESGFYFNKRQDSYLAACKVCENKRSRAWQKSNPENTSVTLKKYAKSEKGIMRRIVHANSPKGKESRKSWRQSNPEKCRQYTAQYKASLSREKLANIKAYQFDYDLRRNYGITAADWQRMYDNQNGLCATCGCKPSGKGSGGKLHVDHAHATGKVRGLLCLGCNRGAGFFDEDTTRLAAMIDYLQFHREGLRMSPFE